MEAKGIQCTARVVERSAGKGLPELWTIQYTSPRLIHSEFMTHRVHSRNASSSRAQPVKKMLEQVRNNPARPVRFGGNKPGMQDTGGEHDGPIRIPAHQVMAFIHWCDKWESWNATGRQWPTATAYDYWQFCAEQAACQAEAMMEAGYHKQVCNRLLEPFQFISVIVTSTEWDNFFMLRDHGAADPTMEDLAHTLRMAMEMAPPAINRPLGRGEDSWHLPYVREDERQFYELDELRSMSVARCARVSYLNHDGTNPDVAKDIVLASKLMTSGHLSPFEHQAANCGGEWPSGNLRRWGQYRKLLEFENEIGGAS